MSEQTPIPMYNPNTIIFRKRLPQKDVKFKPIEDGFITTSGNAELGKKWGNGPSVNYNPSSYNTISTLLRKNPIVKGDKIC